MTNTEMGLFAGLILSVKFMMIVMEETQTIQPGSLRAALDESRPKQMIRFPRGIANSRPNAGPKHRKPHKAGLVPRCREGRPRRYLTVFLRD